jgi:predicted Zn-dependent protease
VSLTQQELNKKRRQAIDLVKQNRLSDARQALQQLLTEFPNDAAGWYWLAETEGRQGNLALAEKYVCNALDANSNYAEAWLGLGKVCETKGRIEDAVRAYGHAVTKKPSLPDAHLALGRIYLHRANFNAALNHLKLVAEQTPQERPVQLMYANALNGAGHYEEAGQVYDAMLKQDTSDVEAAMGRMQVHIELSQIDAALACIERLLTQAPDNVAAQIGRVNTLIYAKRYDEAEAHIRRLLREVPNNPSVCLTYARLAHRFGEAETAITLLEPFTQRNDLTFDAQLMLNFELGRLYDLQHDYERAFHYYQLGNKLKHNQSPTINYTQAAEGIIQSYSHERMAKITTSDSNDRRPVFIVGMPRSGTSLVEQIIASHPSVYGAGELSDIPALLETLLGTNEQAREQRQTLDGLANKYSQHLDQLAPNARYVTDKLPTNFFRLGFIYQLFPHSKVIHCSRDPMDTCLSCYFHHFTGEHYFTYDLQLLGQYYQAYRRMMTHWHAVLPLNIYDLSYESLIDDQEGETRKLLEFLELDWDDRCMEFYKTKRMVVTASMTQVDQPIYKGAVGRWRNYAKFLTPLRQALG